MRLWVGKEKEGLDNGIETLFVESECLDEVELDIVCREAKKRLIKRIYLGAGKKDITYLSPCWVKKMSEYDVMIETSVQNFSKVSTCTEFADVVVRMDLQSDTLDNIILDSIIPKIDTGKQVALYYDYFDNETDKVVDGMYSDTDKEIKL